LESVTTVGEHIEGDWPAPQDEAAIVELVLDNGTGFRGKAEAGRRGVG